LGCNANWRTAASWAPSVGWPVGCDHHRGRTALRGSACTTRENLSIARCRKQIELVSSCGMSPTRARSPVFRCVSFAGNPRNSVRVRGIEALRGDAQRGVDPRRACSPPPIMPKGGNYRRPRVALRRGRGGAAGWTRSQDTRIADGPSGPKDHQLNHIRQCADDGLLAAHRRRTAAVGVCGTG
jgi:hypothetical protein